MTNERKKKKSLYFADFGIPAGSVLEYRKNPEITVKTLDDRNKVEYQGRPYSISTLAKLLAGTPVSGYLYFKYGGKIIKSLAAPDAGAAGIPKETASDEAVSGDGEREEA